MIFKTVVLKWIIKHIIENSRCRKKKKSKHWYTVLVHNGVVCIQENDKPHTRSSGFIQRLANLFIFIFYFDTTFWRLLFIIKIMNYPTVLRWRHITSAQNSYHKPIRLGWHTWHYVQSPPMLFHTKFIIRENAICTQWILRIIMFLSCLLSCLYKLVMSLRTCRFNPVFNVDEKNVVLVTATF